MAASPAAPADAELLRLLDAYGRPWADLGVIRPRDIPATWERIDAARSVLLDYLAAHYVRRDRLYDDGPWEPGDGSAYSDALASQEKMSPKVSVIS